MAGKRFRSIAAVTVIAVLGGAVLADAAIQKPPVGAWKLNVPGTGFTLSKGKGAKRGKIFLSNLHFKTDLFAGCPATEKAVKVLGRYPLKTFTRGGYTAWGVGKNKGGDVAPRAGKVRVAGKTYNGSFHVVWDYLNPRRVSGGSIQFGSCLSQFLYGSHK